jgi:hypothetical protein
MSFNRAASTGTAPFWRRNPGIAPPDALRTTAGTIRPPYDAPPGASGSTEPQSHMAKDAYRCAVPGRSTLSGRRVPCTVFALGGPRRARFWPCSRVPCTVFAPGRPRHVRLRALFVHGGAVGRRESYTARRRRADLYTAGPLTDKKRTRRPELIGPRTLSPQWASAGHGIR